MNTLFLNPETWDLVTDSYGNIAMAESPWATAQDVASACRLWKGEALFDTSRGVPYKSSVLAKLPSLAMLKDWYSTEAKTVPGVIDCIPSLYFADRQLLGELTIKTENGDINVNITD